MYKHFLLSCLTLFILFDSFAQVSPYDYKIVQPSQATSAFAEVVVGDSSRIFASTVYRDTIYTVKPFVKTAHRWEERADLISAEKDSINRFGFKMSLLDDVLIVSSVSKRNAYREWLHIFEYEGNAWRETQIIKPRDIEGNWDFILAQVNSEVIVLRDPDLHNRFLIVVVKDDNGEWKFTQKLETSAVYPKYFGQAMGVLGDTLYTVEGGYSKKIETFLLDRATNKFSQLVQVDAELGTDGVTSLDVRGKFVLSGGRILEQAPNGKYVRAQTIQRGILSTNDEYLVSGNLEVFSISQNDFSEPILRVENGSSFDDRISDLFISKNSLLITGVPRKKEIRVYPLKSIFNHATSELLNANSHCLCSGNSSVMRFSDDGTKINYINIYPFEEWLRLPFKVIGADGGILNYDGSLIPLGDDELEANSYYGQTFGVDFYKRADETFDVTIGYLGQEFTYTLDKCPLREDNEVLILCPGDTIRHGGNEYTEAGMYEVEINDNGYACDAGAVIEVKYPVNNEIEIINKVGITGYDVSSIQRLLNLETFQGYFVQEEIFYPRVSGRYVAVTKCGDFSNEVDIDLFEQGGEYLITSFEEDDFGTGLAYDNGNLIVGMEGYYPDDYNYLPGLVMVYNQNGQGDWEPRDTLLTERNYDSDRLGNIIDISGDYIVVGDPDRPERFRGEKFGAVLIFELDSSGHWEASDTLYPISKDFDYGFGSDVSVLDDVIAVVAEGHPFTDGSSGAVYIYSRINEEWVRTQIIQKPSHHSCNDFASSIELTSTGLYISSLSINNTGVVSHYIMDANDDFIYVSDILPDNGDGITNFGKSFATQGDTIVVGANSNEYMGLASIYIRKAGKWTLASSFESIQSSFGDFVDIEDDHIVVSAPNESGKGRVYHYQLTQGQYELKSYIRPKSFRDNSFGTHLLIINDELLVSSWFEEYYDRKGRIQEFDLKYQLRQSDFVLEEFCGLDDRNNVDYRDLASSYTLRRLLLSSEDPSLDVFLNENNNYALLDEHGSPLPTDASVKMQSVGDSLYVLEYFIRPNREYTFGIKLGAIELSFSGVGCLVYPARQYYPLICDGDSLQVGDTTYFNTGVYEDTLLASTSFFDSIVLHDLRVGFNMNYEIKDNSIVATGDSEIYKWVSCDPENSDPIHAVTRYNESGIRESIVFPTQTGEYKLQYGKDSCIQESICFYIDIPKSTSITSATETGKSTGVDIYGDVAAVGKSDNYNEGSVKIYRKENSSWVASERLGFSGGPGVVVIAQNYLFGSDLAMYDDLLAVGSPGAVGAIRNRRDGAVYVYEDVEEEFGYKYKLAANEEDNYEKVGDELDLYQSDLFVSAIALDSQVKEKHLFYFDLNKHSCFPDQIIKAPDGYTGVFGNEFSIGNSNAIISNYRDSVYNLLVYGKDSSGAFQLETVVQDSVLNSVEFGTLVDVKINKDLIAIGLTKRNDGNTIGGGRVRIYKRNETGDWLFFQELRALDVQWGDMFGRSVDIVGSTVTVGASGKWVKDVRDSGVIYSYKLDSNNVYQEEHRYHLEEPILDHELGVNHAASNNKIIAAGSSSSSVIFEDDPIGVTPTLNVATACDCSDDTVILDSLGRVLVKSQVSFSSRLTDFLVQSSGQSIYDSSGTIASLEDIRASSLGDSLLVLEFWHHLEEELTLYVGGSQAMYPVTIPICKSEQVVDLKEVICAGGTYVYNDSTYSADVSFIDTVYFTENCRVIYKIQLDFLNEEVYLENLGDSIVISHNSYPSRQWYNCDTGEPVLENGTFIGFDPECAGNYRLISRYGDCVDTTVCVFINQRIEESYELVELCEGDVYEFAGGVIDESGLYRDSSVCNYIETKEVQFINLSVPEILDLAGDTLQVIGDNYDSYQWINCFDNSKVDDGDLPVFVPRQSGSYAAIVTYHGCRDTSECFDVVVNFTKDESKSAELEFAPNPSTGLVKVKVPIGLNEAKIIIYNYQLNEIYSEDYTILNGVVELDLSHLAFGWYFVRCLNEEHDSTGRLYLSP